MKRQRRIRARDRRFCSLQDRRPHLRPHAEPEMALHQHQSRQMAADRPVARRAIAVVDAASFVRRDQASKAPVACATTSTVTAAVSVEARHGAPVLGRVAPCGDLGEARRPHGDRDRRVHRSRHSCLRRMQPDPVRLVARTAPSEGPRDRRVPNAMKRTSASDTGDPILGIQRGLDARRTRLTHVKMGLDRRQLHRQDLGGEQRVPAHGRRDLQPRRLPRRGRREPDSARAQLRRRRASATENDSLMAQRQSTQEAIEMATMATSALDASAQGGGS